jgi:hypothetical protein
MRMGHWVGLIAVILLVAILAIAFVTPVRTEQPASPPIARPSPSVPLAIRASASPTAASATPPSSPSPTFVDRTYNFSVVLPEPYRKSEQLSLNNTGSQRPAAHDAFTARTPEDEATVAGQRV